MSNQIIKEMYIHVRGDRSVGIPSYTKTIKCDDLLGLFGIFDLDCEEDRKFLEIIRREMTEIFTQVEDDHVEISFDFECGESQ